MKRIIIALCAVLSLNCVCFAKASSFSDREIKCEGTEFGISQFTDMLEITRVSFGASFTSSDGILRVKNNGKLKVSDYLFVVAFLGSDNQQVASVAAFQNRRTGQGIVDPRWLAVHAFPQGVPISAGGSANIAFESPVVPRSCPESARIDAYYIKFEDGRVVSGGFETIRPDPVLVSARPIPIGFAPIEFKDAIVLEMDIDSAGHVVNSKSNVNTGQIFSITNEWQFSSCPGRPLTTISLTLVPRRFDDLKETPAKLPRVLQQTSEVVQLIPKGREWITRLPVSERSIGALQDEQLKSMKVH